MTEAPVVHSQDHTTYHLEFTGPELMMTWAALRSMLNDWATTSRRCTGWCVTYSRSYRPPRRSSRIDMEPAFRRPRSARAAGAGDDPVAQARNT